ncbi:hypothetical protein BJY52DRAFT_1183931 [Lactarius psammicola]|nr:hypothetical protein BJY52DRAFT_1183931 [Lactarius psammicola]
MQAQGGLGIDDPSNESRLHVVLDFADVLIDDFASRLLDGAYDHEIAWSIPNDDKRIEHEAAIPDPDVQPRTCERVQNHGLDVPRAAIITSERIIERILDTYPSSAGSGQRWRRSPRKMLLEPSMEWKVVESEIYVTAPT